MKILGTLLHNYKFILGLTLLLATLSITAILHFKLNLGSDFQEKTVMHVKFNENITADQLAGVLNSLEIPSPERIDQQGGNSFNIYYANLSDQDKENLVNNLIKSLPTLYEQFFYTSAPPVYYQIKYRLTLTAVISAFLYLIYLALTLRNIQLSRSSLLRYLLTDILTLLWQLLILLGFLCTLGATGVVMDSWFFTSFLLAGLLLPVYKIITTLKFRDFLMVSDNPENLSESWNKFVRKAWLFLALLSIFTVFLLMIPMLVLPVPFIYTSIFIGVSLTAANWDFLVLKNHLFELADSLKFLDKIKILKKQW